MDRRAWMWLTLLASIWGASYLFIKIGLDAFSPAAVSWIRVTLAALLIVPLAARRGALDGLGGQVAAIVLLAAVQVAGPFLLIALGEEEISSGLAGILVATTPIFTALLALRVDAEERSDGWRLLGIGLGIVGVGLLFGLDLSGSSAAVLGGVAVVVASLGYAIGSLFVKRRFAGHRPLGIVGAVMAASSVLLLAPAALTTPYEAPGIGPVAALVALGVIGTGFAFVIFYELIARVGAAKTLLVTYLAPGFAVLYGVLLLDEPLTVATVAGLALIVGGSWLAAQGGRQAAEEPVALPEPVGFETGS